MGLALMLLSGCARDEFAPYLAFPMPQSYEAARSVQPTRPNWWWTKFGSKELDSLMEATNIDNLDIAVAVAQLKGAEAQVEITGAMLWPTIKL